MNFKDGQKDGKKWYTKEDFDRALATTHHPASS